MIQFKKLFILFTLIIVSFLSGCSVEVGTDINGALKNDSEHLLCTIDGKLTTDIKGEWRSSSNTTEYYSYDDSEKRRIVYHTREGELCWVQNLSNNE